MGNGKRQCPSFHASQRTYAAEGAGVTDPATRSLSASPRGFVISLPRQKRSNRDTASALVAPVSVVVHDHGAGAPTPIPHSPGGVHSWGSEIAGSVPLSTPVSPAGNRPLFAPSGQHRCSDSQHRHSSNLAASVYAVTKARADSGPSPGGACRPSISSSPPAPFRRRLRGPCSPPQ